MAINSAENNYIFLQKYLDKMAKPYYGDTIKRIMYLIDKLVKQPMIYVDSGSVELVYHDNIYCNRNLKFTVGDNKLFVEKTDKEDHTYSDMIDIRLETINKLISDFLYKPKD